MATRTPTSDPSNRWPWIALALVALRIVVGVAAFLLNRGNTVNVTISGTPTANAVAKPAASVPPTLAVPTRPASQPTTTPAPSATPQPSATPDCSSPS